jgi:hypothetical protein
MLFALEFHSLSESQLCDFSRLPLFTPWMIEIRALGIYLLPCQNVVTFAIVSNYITSCLNIAKCELNKLYLAHISYCSFPIKYLVVLMSFLATYHHSHMKWFEDWCQFFNVDTFYSFFQWWTWLCGKNYKPFLSPMTCLPLSMHLLKIC